MSAILAECQKYSGMYYDDMIIFSNVKHLREILGKLGEYGMLVNMKKFPSLLSNKVLSDKVFSLYMHHC